ncbi:MAG: catalase, partial [Betaproteobacteria bacterium]|nr:catalase [Betaproteobacteria bacterium]
MAARKQTTKTSDKANSGSGAKSAATSAKTTLSGPTRKGGAAAIVDAATAKIAGTESVAASFPHNAAKPSEYARTADAVEPAAGQTVEPPHPMVTGSTLTEVNASEKVGKGNPQVSFNPTNGPLDRVRVDSGGRVLTTNQGVPVADNQNSLK